MSLLMSVFFFRNYFFTNSKDAYKLNATFILKVFHLHVWASLVLVSLVSLVVFFSVLNSERYV